jgi:hypothetical protein
MGRKTYEKLLAVLNSTFEDWSDVRYVVYDLPASMDNFESRLDQLNQLALPVHVHIAKYIKCQGLKHLHENESEVIGSGGKGIMAYNPNG